MFSPEISANREETRFLSCSEFGRTLLLTKCNQLLRNIMTFCSEIGRVILLTKFNQLFRNILTNSEKPIIRCDWDRCFSIIASLE